MSTMPDARESQMVRRRYINPPPSGSTDTVDVAALKREFAKRLQKLMTDKGWNQSDLARAAAKFMAYKKFNRDNVSLYVRAQQLPGPVRLRAMAKALDIKEEQLLPPGAVASVDEGAPPLAMRPLGSGNVWLQINQAVSQEIAMQVVTLLGQAQSKKK
jgi:transcriptional regulator with XRE-family HTH domain